jgi:hypothetical protein
MCVDCNKAMTLLKGKDGLTITSTVDNGDGTFTITYSDGTTFTSADLTGPQGPPGADSTVPGPQGPASTVPGPPGDSGVGYLENSVTSTSIATGSKIFTVTISASNSAYIVGSYIRIVSTSSPSNYMEGTITAFSGTTLTVDVTTISGSGTFASWAISIAGVPGLDGSGGVSIISVASPTVTFSGSGITATITNKILDYTKIGNFYTIHYSVGLSNVNSAALNVLNLFIDLSSILTTDVTRLVVNPAYIQMSSKPITENERIIVASMASGTLKTVSMSYKLPESISSGNISVYGQLSFTVD